MLKTGVFSRGACNNLMAIVFEAPRQRVLSRAVPDDQNSHYLCSLRLAI